MLDSRNDGDFVIGKGGTFSKAIIKELKLSEEQGKKIRLNDWQNIFAIAEQQNMHNLGNVSSEDRFVFSRENWEKIVQIVEKKINMKIKLDFEKEVPVEIQSESESEPKTKEKQPKEIVRTAALHRKDGKKLAADLYSKINPSFGLSTYKDFISNSGIINVLNKINSEQIAYVVDEYKKISKDGIVFDIDNEFNLDINTVKKHICEKLLTRAQALDMDLHKLKDYNAIKDLQTLNSWVQELSQKIINRDKNNNDKLSSSATVEITHVTGFQVKTISNSSFLKEAGIKKIQEKMDSAGNSIEKMFYFQDGKQVLEKYVSSYVDSNGSRKTSTDFIISTDSLGHYFVKDKSSKTYKVNENYQFECEGKIYTIVSKREIIKESSSDTSGSNPKIYEPLEFKINMPEGASKSAKRFAMALMENKEQLMKVTGLDSDTYNRLAKLSLAIAEQETNFGKPNNHLLKAKYDVATFFSDTIVSQKWQDGNNNEALSVGMTQLKYNNQSKDLKNKMKEFDISCESDLTIPEKSAIATLITLANFNKKLQNENYQRGINAARGVVIEQPGWELVDGHAKNTGRTKPWINDIKDEDVLSYLWNQGARRVINGSISPETNTYVRNIRKYMEKYSIEEDSQIREKALLIAEKQRQNNNMKKVPSLKNNGNLGSMLFTSKPNIGYAVGSFEYNQIKEALIKNNVPQDKIVKILSAFEKGLVSFKYNFNSNKVNEIRGDVVDLILKYVSEAQAGNKNATGDFKKEYLLSIAKQLREKDVPQKSIVILNDNKYKAINFVGNIADNGVKTNTGDNITYDKKNNKWNIENLDDLTPSELLAIYAQQEAIETSRGGRCMTHFRKAMIKSGIDAARSASLAKKLENVSDYVYNNSPGYYLNEGSPKKTVEWCERHPEMFDEVKFVQCGNGNVRQITSADLINLPSGYIVLWIPGEGFEEEPGHSCITNGNGLAYADETDNLAWGDIGGKNPGKGEQGYFRVFKLTDSWKVTNGKLVFES